MSAFVPPCCTAITWYVPAVAPAVYSPLVETLPPVALHVTLTLPVDPSLIFPAALNCCVALAATPAVAGVTTTDESVGVAGGVAAASCHHPCRRFRL